MKKLWIGQEEKQNLRMEMKMRSEWNVLKGDGEKVPEHLNQRGYGNPLEIGVKQQPTTLRSLQISLFE